MRYVILKKYHFIYLSGKPMTPHLLRYQGLAVDDYSCGLDALDLGYPRRRRASLDFRSFRVKQMIQIKKRAIRLNRPSKRLWRKVDNPTSSCRA